MTIGLAYNNDLSRVQITGSDLLPGVVRVERSVNQLLWEIVRGGLAIPVSGGAIALDDFEFAADVENHYRIYPISLENLMEVFTSSGTWNKPAGLIAARIRVIGGGGGGGGVALTGANETAVAGGGGGGEYAESLIPAASLGSSETVTVSAGGGGGSAGNNSGTAGSSSSFGTLVSATGGGAGPGSAAINGGVSSSVGGGVGGTGGTGDILIPGSPGGNGGQRLGDIEQWPFGGGSHMGSTTQIGASSFSGGPGVNGEVYGSGGSGAYNYVSQAAGRAGGAGAAGIVIVEHIFWPPDA